MMKKMQTSTEKTTRAAKGITSEFEKIPRRMIVAGGAALMFSATIGGIRRGIEAWNMALDQTREKLNAAVSATQNLIQMMPPGAARAGFPELIGEAKTSPLLLGELAAIREGVYSLLTPEKGFTGAQRREAEAVGRAFVRARGLPPAAIVEALGKAQFAFPATSARQMGNIFSGVMTQAAFIGENLQQLLPQMTKGFGPAAEMGMDPAQFMALMTVMTQYAGTPARAAQGVGGILTAIQADPRLRARAGITAGMTPSEQLRQLHAAGLDVQTMVKAGLGKRYAGRAALAFGEEGFAAQEQLTDLYRGYAARPGIMEHAEWQRRLAAEPYLRHYEMQRMTREMTELEALEPTRVRAATIDDMVDAQLAEMYPGTRAGQFARWWQKGVYNIGKLFAGEAGAAGGMGFGPGFNEQVGRVHYWFGDTAPQVPPADVGQRNINLGTEPLGEE